MSSTKKNLWYQTLYQILNVGLPLITAPFLSRVLGAEPLGIMSYTSSVVHYFSLFAMMGLTNYGTRSIAIVKKNIEERDKVFSQIFFLQLFTSSIALVSYGIYMFLFCHENYLIAWIQVFAILACFGDINWFFFGIEEFKLTVIRNVIIRVSSVVLMLVLVKNPEDLWIYAILLVGSSFVNQLVLWWYVPKYVRFRMPKMTEIKKHFMPNLKLFIPLLAMSVFHIMDKTMLGVFSTYEQSGYYYNADKVINIPIGLLTGIGTVMLPRMSALAAANRRKELDGTFNEAIRAIGFSSAAMCCGIAAIAKEFTPFFFGRGFDSCVILIISLAPVLFIKGLSLISRNLFLIPNNMENKLTSSVIAGAVVNLVVNLLLIPKLGALGAVIGTLVAETVACIWQYCVIVKRVECRNSIISCVVYFFLGMVMFLGVRLVAHNIVAYSSIIKLVLEIVAGFVLYIVLCIGFWILTHNRRALGVLKQLFKRSH